MEVSARLAGLYRQHPDAVWSRRDEPALPLEEKNVYQYSGAVLGKMSLALANKGIKLKSQYESATNSTSFLGFT